MKISTEIDSIARIVGKEKAVALCAEAGFDAWDFSLFDIHKTDWQTGLPLPDISVRNNRYYLQVARELKQIGLDNGIVCTVLSVFRKRTCRSHPSNFPAARSVVLPLRA